MVLPQPPAHPARSILFGAGDFGFNLYWQALSLYLLFFYTDHLGLSPGAAAGVMAAGAVMDGVADLAIGVAADRWRLSYRRIVAWGAAPLGVAFALVFADHPAGGLSVILALHLLFRLLYALVNLPYAAWSIRVSGHSGDRTLMSGARMAFGAAGAVTVAFAMPALGGGYDGTAMLFAAVATAILLGVIAVVPETLPPVLRAEQRSFGRDLAALAANRAFVTLTLAALGATVAGALIGHSVLYHFTHNLADAGSGHQAMAMMGIVGTAVVPVWTLIALKSGARMAWLFAAALMLATSALFALAPMRGTAAAALFFLGAVQAGLSGCHLTAWAMLPDAIDRGAATGGTRVEATAFSLFMLVQKIGLGLAAALLGAVYAQWGYRGGAPDAGARAAILWLMVLGPATAILLGAVAMAMNPLKVKPAVA